MQAFCAWLCWVILIHFRFCYIIVILTNFSKIRPARNIRCEIAEIRIWKMSANQHILDNALQLSVRKAVRAGYWVLFHILWKSGNIYNQIIWTYLTLSVWTGSGQVKKITSLKQCVFHVKSSLLSETVAKDHLVSFPHGNSILDFRDLINKSKQRTAFFFFFP